MTHSNPKNNSSERRVYTYGETLCGFEGCTRRAKTRYLCAAHNHQRYLGKPLVPLPESAPCVIETCDRNCQDKNSRNGLCKVHYKVSWRYNISADKINELYSNPECSNIGCPRPGTSIDHDHNCCDIPSSDPGPVSCGECVRGLLCRQCNTALGMLQDDPDRILGLVEYLRRYAVIS